MDAKTSLQTQVEAWAQAIISQDIEIIMSHYADNVRAFDAIGPLEFTGRDSYKAHWQKCMSSCSLTAFEISAVETEVNDDLAACSFLNRCGGKDENGEEKACWMRATQVYKNQDGRWLIIHEHFSLPFDMNSFEIQFDLTP